MSHFQEKHMSSRFTRPTFNSLLRSAACALTLAVGSLSSTPSFAAAEELKDATRMGQANIKQPEVLPVPVSTNEPLPTAPSPVAGYRYGIVKQAGIGGNTAYARAGVLELGGGLSYAQSSGIASVAVTPSIGWFFADNFELSFIGKYDYNHVPVTTAGSKNNTTIDTHLVNLLIEPSVHIPVVDNLFLFAGWGLGVAFKAPNAAAGFSMTPRLGVNILIGRSGILTPALDLSFISNGAVTVSGVNSAVVAVNTRYGAQITYGVMW
jgi:hypothetical protein